MAFRKFSFLSGILSGLFKYKVIFPSVIYSYFTFDSYSDYKSVKEFNKKKVLRYASFIASFLILISGIIFLVIAITDDNIDTEIAFN